MAVFQKATKRAAKLRMALIGPAGSGKTYSALNIGKYLGARIAVIDTEHGSASKYADLFEFDTVEPTDFSPQTYTDLIRAAEAAGYDVLVIDSLSHAWIGRGGALELVDRASRKNAQSGSSGNRGNSFGAWRDVTPLHNELVDTILATRLHVIATMRTKMAYEQEQRPDPRTGQMRTVVAKLGLQPIQREGVEYEFDVVGDLNLENVLTVSKTRCPALKDASVELPGKQIADALRVWLDSGAPALADERTSVVAPRSARSDEQSFAHALPNERSESIAPQPTLTAQPERATQPERPTQPARIATPTATLTATPTTSPMPPRIATEERAASTLAAAAPRTSVNSPTPVSSASQPSAPATPPERGAEANRVARAAASADAVTNTTHAAATPVSASNPRLAPHIAAAPAQTNATVAHQTTDANHHLREEIRAKLPLAQKTERGLQGYLAQKYAADNLNDLNATQLREVLQLLNTKIAEK